MSEKKTTTESISKENTKFEHAVNLALSTHEVAFDGFKEETKKYESYHDCMVSIGKLDGTTDEYLFSLKDIEAFKEVKDTPHTKEFKPVKQMIDVPMSDREGKIEKLRIAFGFSGINVSYQDCDLIADVMTQIGEVGGDFDIGMGSALKAAWRKKWEAYEEAQENKEENESKK